MTKEPLSAQASHPNGDLERDPRSASRATPPAPGPAAPNTVAAGTNRLSPALVRPFASADLPQVLELYGEIFGDQARRWYEARWRWSQEQNLFPAETRRWVVATGERVVGFLGTVPLPYLIAGQPVVAHTPCDYMVHPDFRFHGIALMKAFFAECANCVSCDVVPATVKVTRRLGAHAAGTLVRFVRPLHGDALSTVPPWDRLPAAARRLAVGAVELGRRARRGQRPSGFRIEEVTDFDERFDTFLSRLAREVGAMPLRDRRFLHWRYGPSSPHAARGIRVALSPGGELVGYVVFHGPSGPDRTGQILDLQVLPDAGDGVAAELLDRSVRALRAGGAWKACCTYLPSPHAVPRAELEAQGFIARGDIQLLVKFADPEIEAVATRPWRWSLSYGDTEDSHASAGPPAP